MANPLGIVARLTHHTLGTASDYFNKFNELMKSGRLDNISFLVLPR